jgi:MerR family transcriptional regulator/heat shock protein HspR
MTDRPETDASKGVYGISVAADLVGLSIPALRLYEARRLLSPDRTEGGTRRYSQDDLDRLRHIRDLLEAGLNLAGVEAVLALEGENQELRDENEAHRRRK